MSVESRTVRPNATGSIRAAWREQYGAQRVNIAVDPGRRAGQEFRVAMERRWGGQLTDVSDEAFWLSREGAAALRDALTAALEWEAKR